MVLGSAFGKSYPTLYNAHQGDRWVRHLVWGKEEEPTRTVNTCVLVPA